MTTAGGVHGHVHSHSANNKLIYVILLLVAYCLLLSFQPLYEMAQMSSRKGITIEHSVIVETHIDFLFLLLGRNISSQGH